MSKRITGLRNKFVLFGLSVMLVLSFSYRINVQAADFTIKQEVSTSSGQPGDVIQLSVYVQGLESSIEAAKVRGVLEYDTSLFAIQGVTGNGFKTDKVNQASGRFSMTTNRANTLQNGDLLCKISLLINDDASVGKTTVCVNKVVISDTAEAETQISNYVPTTIKLESANPVEDEKNKEENESSEKNEDFDDVDDYGSVATAKSETASSSNSTKKENDSSSDSKNASISVVKHEVSTTKNTDKLDENYKTGAGFGNDIYLIVAGIMGIGGMGVYLVRRKWMKKKYKYL